MINVKPSGHYLTIILDPVDDELKSEGGIIIAQTSTDKKREQAAGSFASVSEVGPNCWAGFTDPDGNWSAWCKPGDRVMVAKYAGQAYPIPDNLPKEEKNILERMRLIKDDDILGVVEGEE